jgi:hypothetical protein
MCVCTETDVRESVNDCTLASGEGHSSRGETFHLLYAASSVPLPLNTLYKVRCISQKDTHYIIGYRKASKLHRLK